MAAQRSDAEGRYKVRDGDTLSEIAAREGTSTEQLAAANGIDDHDVVYAGTWLDVPDGGGAPGGGAGGAATRHTVRAGENLIGIASRYGLSAASLAEANGIDDPDVVVIGTQLRLPIVAADSSELPARLRQSSNRLALMGTFDHWAAQYGVPADLLKAMTWLESGWQTGVVSSTGAVGIGQLMPDTVGDVNGLLGTELDPKVPEENIRMSARYLRLLLDVTGGDTGRALAGYYQGLGSVERNGLYASTRDYVASVQALRARFA